MAEAPAARTGPRHLRVADQPGPEVDASLRRMGRGSTVNLLGTVVAAVANFALVVAVTRGLPQDTAGVFISMTSIFLIVTVVGQLGANTGLVFFLSRSLVTGRTSDVPAYMRLAMRTVVTTAVAIALVLVLGSRPIAHLVTPGREGLAAGYLVVLALFVPVAGFANISLAGTRGLGSMRANASVEFVLRPAVQVVAVAVVLALGAKGLVSWAWALPYLPAAVLGWWSWRRLAASRGVPPRTRVAVDRREFWAFSGPRALTSVVQIIMQRLDIVLVAALAGPAPAAVYAAATRFVVAGQMGSNAISLAAQPRFAEMVSRDDAAGLAEIYRTTTAWLVAVTWPLYLTFIVSGELLLRVFGRGYGVGASVITVLAACMLVSTAIGMADPLLSMSGRTTLPLVNSIVALVVQIAVDVVLIPSHGVLGAAIGWGTAILLRNLAALAQCVSSMGIHSMSRPVVVSIALNVACFGLVPLTLRELQGQNWMSLTSGLALGTGIYVLALWRLRRVLRVDALLALRSRRRQA